MNAKKIVIFDFDGTITTKDTMLDFVKWHFGSVRFYLGMLCILPILTAYKLSIIKNTVAKEAFLKKFLKNIPYDKFCNLANEYSLQVVSTLVKPEALKKINLHRQKNEELIIISASPKEWILPWASKNGFTDVLSTKLEVQNGILTGRLEGKNCYGIEKVNKFIEKYKDLKNYYVIMYGDSNGDKQLLQISNERYYKKYN